MRLRERSRFGGGPIGKRRRRWHWRRCWRTWRIARGCWGSASTPFLDSIRTNTRRSSALRSNSLRSNTSLRCRLRRLRQGTHRGQRHRSTKWQHNGEGDCERAHDLRRRTTPQAGIGVLEGQIEGSEWVRLDFLRGSGTVRVHQLRIVSDAFRFGSCAKGDRSSLHRPRPPIPHKKPIDPEPSACAMRAIQCNITSAALWPERSGS